MLLPLQSNALCILCTTLKKYNLLLGHYVGLIWTVLYLYDAVSTVCNVFWVMFYLSILKESRAFKSLKQTIYIILLFFHDDRIYKNMFNFGRQCNISKGAVKKNSILHKPGVLVLSTTWRKKALKLHQVLVFQQPFWHAVICPA